MSRIRSLKPNLSRDEAVAYFSSGRTLDGVRTLFLGPLRSVADLYIPFRLFRVEVSNLGQTQFRFLALDAVQGTLDLYDFPQAPSSSDVVMLETRNCLTSGLDDACALELLRDKFRRLLFAHGFFRLRKAGITATALPGEIYIPYWVGFRGRGIRAHVEVIDAVRRRSEGAKVRKLIEEWIVSAP